MRTYHAFATRSILLLIIVFMSACSNDSNSTKNNNNEATITSIKISNGNGELKTNDTTTLRVIATLSDGSTTDLSSQVSWESNDEEIASITSNGALDTHLYVDDVTITAKFQSLQDAVNFSVRPNDSASLKNFNFASGTTTTDLSEQDEVVVTGNYDDGSIDRKLKLRINAISKKSNGTTEFQMSTSQANYKAVAAEPNENSGTLVARIESQEIITPPAITLSEIIIQSNLTSVEVGKQISVTAEAVYSNGNKGVISDTVTWSSDNNASLAYDSSNNTFRATNSPGNANIVASLDGTESNSLSITVTAASGNNPAPIDAVLQSIVITPTVSEILVQTSTTFTAKATYGNEPAIDITDKVTWSSDTPSVLALISVISVNKNMFRGGKPGSATVVASLGGISSNPFVITVKALPVVTLLSLNIAPLTATRKEGETQTYTLTGKYSNNPTVAVAITGNTLWKVTNDTNNTSTDNVNGTFVAGTTGNYIIRASVGGQSITAKLIVGAAAIVNDPILTSIQISADKTQLRNTETSVLTVMGSYDVGAPQDLTGQVAWSINNNNFSLNNNQATARVNVGTSQITASVAGKTASINLTITDTTISGIQILVPTTDLYIDATQQLVVHLNYINGARETITSQVDWMVNDTSLLSVVNGQVQSAGFLGETEITAIYKIDEQTFTASTTIAVIANDGAILESIRIVDRFVTMEVLSTHRLQVRAIYSDQSESMITTGLTWESQNNDIATVDANGIVSSLDIGGVVRIIANYTPVNANTAFKDSIKVTVSNLNSFDNLRLAINNAASQTYIEDNSDIKPTIDAFNNPVGLLSTINLLAPFAGFFMIYDSFDTEEQLVLAIHSPSVGNFDKSQALAVYRSITGEYYDLDNSEFTALTLVTDNIGTFNQNTSANFDTTLCRRSIINNGGDCADPANQIKLSGSFFAKTNTDNTFQSFSNNKPKLIDQSLNAYQQINQQNSFYRLRTTVGSEYQIQAISSGADVGINILGEISQADSNNAEQSLTFIAKGVNTAIEFTYLGNDLGTTFELVHRATAPTAQGSATSPIVLNSGDVFFRKPGQVDNRSSYYEINVTPGYTYRIIIKKDSSEAGSKTIAALSYRTNTQQNITDCRLGSLGYVCIVETGSANSIIIKVDGPVNGYSKYKITAEYNLVRDPDNYQESLTVALADMVNLTGQVTFGTSPTPEEDFNNGGNTNFGGGISAYWVKDLSPETFYKIRLSDLNDNTRLWVNGPNLIDPKLPCNAVGITEATCIVKTKLSATGLALNVENSPNSVGSVGTTYTLNMEAVPETELYYFSTFKNNSTRRCTQNCERLGYAIYAEDNAIPFAVSITSQDQFHKKLLHIKSGQTLYIRINDIRSRGDAYSIMINKTGYLTSTASNVTDPDAFEVNNDNLRSNATRLNLGDISSHSLSKNPTIDGDTFGDIDWLVFTAP